MANFHISQDGVARQCTAKTPESCTATSPDLREHFTSKEEAQKAYEVAQSNKGLKGLSKTSHTPTFTKESLIEETNHYIQQFKDLDRDRRKTKSKIESSYIMTEQTAVASKILDNAWDMKELTGSAKDLKQYKNARKSTLKTVQREFGNLEKELETWENIHRVQGGWLDHSQRERVKAVRQRRVKAREFINDLKAEIIQEKTR